MKVLSVNVGVPREVQWRNDRIATPIHKSPVEGRIAAKRLNLDGDRQADLAVHGGPEKAIYAYPIEHYAYWREALPGVPLPSGVFGENLTIEGLLEPMVRGRRHSPDRDH
jgi:MOSC domain-containing protein YiiM